MLEITNYNPDVLSCLANLSSDEVFTPPQLANSILDLLPGDIWRDEHTRFLDPFCKTGVFLREIAKRLDAELEKQIPDRQKRINHIFGRQLFGIAITELTSLLSRRSVYCSKTANGKYSVCETFDTPEGNIRFERIEHTWKKGRCVYCGANEENYERGGELETHAYEFIHTEQPKEIFKMKFDVIIGNPPYQLSDGGFGESARPIYHLFVEQAKKLNPRYLTMIIPSRWFAGGKGLDKFRERMLHDQHLRILVDFLNASDAFPGVDIAGGIMYFLWDRDNEGDCNVTTVHRGESVGPTARKLDEFDIFVRHAPSVAILHKVWPKGPIYERSMGAMVSARNAFGFATNYRGQSSTEGLKDPIELVSSATSKGHQKWVDRNAVSRNAEWINEWKSTVGGAAPAGGRPDKDGRYYGLSSIRVLPPRTVCTESYLVAGHFASESDALALDCYMRTRFVRFLVSLRAVTQHVTRGSFAFVPVQDFATQWTDEKLYKKYDLTKDEIAFIESMVRPMDASNE